MKRSEIVAAGFSADSLRDTCWVVTQDTASTLRRLVFSYQRSAPERSRILLCTPVRPFRKSESALHNTIVSSSAWLVPCASVGGIVCAASPSNVTAPWPERGIGCRKCGNGERARSSSVNVASTRSTESDHPLKLDRIISIGRPGLTKSGDHGKSNHHCTSEPPAGHRPRLPCSPIIICATCLLATCGRVTSPCQLHQPVGSADCAATVSRTTECRPSAPINKSPSVQLPSSNSSRTPSCLLMIPTE